jgi:hypothetical protein
MSPLQNRQGKPLLNRIKLWNPARLQANDFLIEYGIFLANYWSNHYVKSIQLDIYGNMYDPRKQAKMGEKINLGRTLAECLVRGVPLKHRLKCGEQLVDNKAIPRYSDILRKAGKTIPRDSGSM